MLSKKWFWLIVIAITWEVTARNGLIPSYIFPPLTTIMARSYTLLRYEGFGNVILASIKTILHGFVISFSAAIVVASISGYCKSFRTLVMALHDILNPLPSVAILPIVLLVCGLTKDSLSCDTYDEYMHNTTGISEFFVQYWYPKMENEHFCIYSCNISIPIIWSS